jgi:surfactin synthase thioesterase subunit
MIFVPCCILTHTRAHLFSSTEWHMQRQQRPPGSFIGSCRDAPVNDDETRTMTKTADMALLGMLIHLAFGFFAESAIRKVTNCLLHLVTSPQD